MLLPRSRALLRSDARSRPNAHSTAVLILLIRSNTQYSSFEATRSLRTHHPRATTPYPQSQRRFLNGSLVQRERNWPCRLSSCSMSVRRRGNMIHAATRQGILKDYHFRLTFGSSRSIPALHRFVNFEARNTGFYQKGVSCVFCPSALFPFHVDMSLSRARSRVDNSGQQTRQTIELSSS